MWPFSGFFWDDLSPHTFLQSTAIINSVSERGRYNLLGMRNEIVGQSFPFNFIKRTFPYLTWQRSLFFWSSFVFAWVFRICVYRLCKPEAVPIRQYTTNNRQNIMNPLLYSFHLLSCTHKLRRDSRTKKMTIVRNAMQRNRTRNYMDANKSVHHSDRHSLLSSINDVGLCLKGSIYCIIPKETMWGFYLLPRIG